MRKSFCLFCLAVLSACVDPAMQMPISASGGFATQLNALRTTRELGPLRANAQLNQAARAHARDMASQGYFSHRSPNGAGAGDRIARTGYQACGWAENIASGLRSEGAALAAWRDSAGHRRNMLQGRFTEYGLGRSGTKWVMVLATRC